MVSKTSRPDILPRIRENDQTLEFVLESLVVLSKHSLIISQQQACLLIRAIKHEEKSQCPLLYMIQLFSQNIFMSSNYLPFIYTILLFTEHLVLEIFLSNLIVLKLSVNI